MKACGSTRLAKCSARLVRKFFSSRPPLDSTTIFGYYSFCIRVNVIKKMELLKSEVKCLDFLFLELHPFWKRIGFELLYYAFRERTRPMLAISGTLLRFLYFLLFLA